jgi:hypothetical protein
MATPSTSPRLTLEVVEEEVAPTNVESTDKILRGPRSPPEGNILLGSPLFASIVKLKITEPLEAFLGCTERRHV